MGVIRALCVRPLEEFAKPSVSALSSVGLGVGISRDPVVGGPLTPTPLRGFWSSVGWPCTPPPGPGQEHSHHRGCWGRGAGASQQPKDLVCAAPALFKTASTSLHLIRC